MIVVRALSEELSLYIGYYSTERELTEDQYRGLARSLEGAVHVVINAEVPNDEVHLIQALYHAYKVRTRIRNRGLLAIVLLTCRTNIREAVELARPRGRDVLVAGLGREDAVRKLVELADEILGGDKAIGLAYRRRKALCDSLKSLEIALELQAKG